MAQKTKAVKQDTPEGKLKLEIAEELGLLEKVMQHGWGGLSAKETGRIGGMITRRKLAEKMKASHKENTEK